MTIEPVASAADPRLADYRDLYDAARRLRTGTFVAEGRIAVRTLLAQPTFRVRTVLVTEAALAALRDVLAPDATVYLAAAATIREVVGFDFHRGCLAVGERSAPPSLEAVLARGPRRVVVLEDLTHPDNVGGVFRNALAFGAAAVLLSPRCCDPFYRKAIRLSAGAVLRVPFVPLEGWPAPLGRLRAAGLTLVALTPAAGAIELAAARLPARVALLLGTEGGGLGAAARAAADVAVRIPMAAGVDSLNVATAAGIALHWLAYGRNP